MDQEQILSTQTTLQTNVDEKKISKKIKTAGIISIVYGIFLILSVFYIFSIAKLINFSVITIAITTLFFGIVLIVLGLKIKSNGLNSKRNWLATLVGFAVILIVLNFVLSQNFNIVGFIFLIVLVDSYTALNKAYTKKI
jgi:hypothetical protein